MTQNLAEIASSERRQNPSLPNCHFGFPSFRAVNYGLTIIGHYGKTGLAKLTLSAEDSARRKPGKGGRVLTIDHRIAADLRQLFGAGAGTRRSVAEIARAQQGRSVYASRVAAREVAFDLMWGYEASGLVDDSPGPRGGAGWQLSTKGAALIAQSLTANLPDRTL